MNYQYGRSAAAGLISSALLMRLFVGMAVDYPVALNAAWLCPLIGLVIYLPVGIALHKAAQLGNGSSWENMCKALPRAPVKLLEALFALLFAWDAAVNVRLTAGSSNIIALGDTTVHLLIVPLAFVIAAIILLGGDALGNGARIALCILPLFAVVVLLVQLPGYRAGWLAPMLGEGIGAVMRGSIYCAGCMVLMSLIWLPGLPDRNQHGLLFCVALPAIGASVLMLTQQMSFPVMPEMEFTRAARIELVLSNGRMSLYPQFVLNILWFGGLLFLLSAEAAASAAWIHRIFPGLKIWILAVLEACAIAAAAIFNPLWLRNSASLIQILYPLLAGLLALPLITILVCKGRKTSCEKKG